MDLSNVFELYIADIDERSCAEKRSISVATSRIAFEEISRFRRIISVIPMRRHLVNQVSSRTGQIF